MPIPSTQNGEVRVALPWPSRDLSPNARLHWARKAKAVKSARTTCAWLVREAIRRKPEWAAADIAMEFCPPDYRRRDRDNLIASMKAATDGLADALGIDDSKFITSYRMGQPVKGGAVLVTVRQA
jgi:crossover junction endodeoxyribonuclease RusA